jgi:hypothetical protein
MRKDIFDEYKQFYIENWHPILRSSGFHRTGIELKPSVVDFLIELSGLEGDIPEFEPEEVNFLNSVGTILKYYDHSAFVRLGSRSHKDSLEYQNMNYEIKNHLDFWLSCIGSNRMKEDLELAKEHQYTPYLWIMQHIDIKPEEEFRVFVKNNEIIGISQYNYHLPYQSIQKNYDSIEWAISMFIQKMKSYSTDIFPRDCIIDLIISQDKSSINSINWYCKFLEINPFSPMTDSCLYTWVDADDGFIIMSHIDKDTGKQHKKSFVYNEREIK